jgi:hypothetical protein
MAHLGNIREGMQVLGSDGGAIGTVIGTEGDQIAVQSAGEHIGHHHIPATWVARVDDHVHLNRTAALAWERAAAHGDGAAGGGHGHGAHSVHVHDEAATARKLKWVPWAILALLVLVGIYALVTGLIYSSEEPDYRNSGAQLDAPDA